jgi:hypothetical protein
LEFGKTSEEADGGEGGQGSRYRGVRPDDERCGREGKDED